MKVTHVVISKSEACFDEWLTWNQNVYLFTQKATLNEIQSLLDEKLGAGRYEIIKLRNLNGNGYHS
jgi:hypothetical protein